MKLIVSSFLLFFAFCLNAQNPTFNVSAQDSAKVRMNKMNVKVKIVGNIAFTNVEMEFFNSTSRQMEGELIFPPPEGISVSHYAIDINGKMRDAVAVNKSKGKQVFEAIENRRVDPGLLEKVGGNNFRTRVYPIPPNGKRVVEIGFEQELAFKNDKNLAYQLLSSYHKKLEEFNIKIEVIGSAEKPKIQGNSEMNFTSWNQNFTTSLEKKNFQPNEKFEILIPIREDIPTVLMQKNEETNYFYTQLFLDAKELNKNKPQTIGLIYDVSLSCKNRDFLKEILLLERYISDLKNVTISLFYLNYNFKKQKDFIITDGNSQELINFLKSAKYDGGTRYSQIKLPNLDEYLFFTDGLSTLSEQKINHPKALFYTITSSVSADFSFLTSLAMSSSANSINLNQLNQEEALSKLTNQNLRFLGIKDNVFVTEVYPEIGSPVSKNFSLAGISLKDQNEITLLFGYGNKVSFEKTFTLNAENQINKDLNVEKIWTQKKIAYLDLNYAKNQEEIEILGNKSGIVTRNTSLIVLETLQDYVSYQIVPPAELREEYNRISKEQLQSSIAQQQSNWKNIDSYFGSLQSWWKKNTKFVEPPKPKDEKLKSTKNRERRITDITTEGLVAYDSPSPPEIQAASPPRVVHQEEAMMVKDEVVEKEVSIGYGKVSKKDAVGSVELLTTKDFNKGTIVSTDQLIKGKVNGVKITENEANPQTRIRGENSSNLEDKPLIVVDGIALEDVDENPLTKLNPNDIESFSILKDASDSSIHRTSNRETIIITTKKHTNNKPKNPTSDFYIKSIKSQPKEKQYNTYLELRDEFQNSPTFYFDVAHYFNNQGDKETALLILSSIGDLGLENHLLYKTLTYTFREWKSYEDALFTAQQVAKWREFEPQSHRDLGLTLEDNKKYQQAFDELIKALNTNYLAEMSGFYTGIEDIILMDLNRMISEHSGIDTKALNKKYLTKMPIDLRVILNWNMANTDIDLHVYDPTGADCYYGNTSTPIGARFSKDFTQGYGPEQYLLRNKIAGKYKITSNYFGENRFTENGPATVLVEIYTKENGKTKRELKTIQLGKVKENGVLKTLNL